MKIFKFHIEVEMVSFLVVHVCMQAEYAKVEVFKTEKKGWGLRALEPIAP